VSWYECDDPHDFVSEGVSCGDTIFYNSWEDGQCKFNEYACDCEEGLRRIAVPAAAKIVVNETGRGTKVIVITMPD
jgi:hypothetical protein